METFDYIIQCGHITYYGNVTEPVIFIYNYVKSNGEIVKPYVYDTETIYSEIDFEEEPILLPSKKRSRSN